MVLETNSADMDAEEADIVKLVGLKPGKAYCEVGGGNGLLLTTVGPAVFPGGKIFGTGKDLDEVTAMLTAAQKAGFPTANISVSVAQEKTSGLPYGACDAIVLRMVYNMLSE